VQLQMGLVMVVKPEKISLLLKKLRKMLFSKEHIEKSLPKQIMTNAGLLDYVGRIFVESPLGNCKNA